MIRAPTATVIIVFSVKIWKQFVLTLRVIEKDVLSYLIEWDGEETKFNIIINFVFTPEDTKQ